MGILGELFLDAVGGLVNIIIRLAQRKISLSVFVILATASFIKISIYGKEELPVYVENVFDEMIEKNYEAMEGAEQVWAGGYGFIRLTCPVAEEPDVEIGFLYSREYKKLYLYGEAKQTEGEEKPYQEYFWECLEKMGISAGELEDYKEQFICRDLLGNWFGKYDSHFSKDNLGNLEVIDYLMPYEYTGIDNGDRKVNVTVETEGYEGLFEGKVTYTEWKAPEGFRCIQQSRRYGYTDVLSHIADDMNGKTSNGESFFITWNGELCKYHAGTFIDQNKMAEWIQQNPDKVYGNLSGLAYSREEGEGRTRILLRNTAKTRIHKTIGECEFYMDDMYLYLRFPYYINGDREYITVGEKEKVKNGEGHFRTEWIAVKWDDIQEFIDD